MHISNSYTKSPQYAVLWDYFILKCLFIASIIFQILISLFKLHNNMHLFAANVFIILFLLYFGSVIPQLQFESSTALGKTQPGFGFNVIRGNYARKSCSPFARRNGCTQTRTLLHKRVTAKYKCIYGSKPCLKPSRRRFKI